MGMNIFNRNCKSSPYAPPGSGNPDPANYSIEKEEKLGNHLILQVRYPNCSNFEGRKIMVFRGYQTVGQLLSATGGKLDPHFSENRAAPVARFKPTEEGWNQARFFASNC